MAGIRKPHSKSRYGCLRCKRKKVKCDEKKPSCGNCLRYSSECSFTTASIVKLPGSQPNVGSQPSVAGRGSVLKDIRTTPTTPDLNTSGSSIKTGTVDNYVSKLSKLLPRTCNNDGQLGSESIPTASASNTTANDISKFPLTRTPPSLDGRLKLRDLELFHVFITSTCLTLSPLRSKQKMWQGLIPKIALKNVFVLEGALAFTALHLMHLEPSDQASNQAALLAEASAYYNSGLISFRSAISNLSKDNCDACFAFSSLLVGYTWASSAGIGNLFFSDSSQSAEEGTTVEWISLLRGAYALLLCSKHWMDDSPLKVSFRLYDNQQDEQDNLQQQHQQEFRCEQRQTVELNSEAEAKFKRLRDLWESPSKSFTVEEITTLNDTLILLQALYAKMTEVPNTRVDVIALTFTWPSTVPDLYIKMANRRVPEALILLAHFCLLLNIVDHYWWVHGMSRSLLFTISQTLGKEWEDWLAWPLQDLTLSEFQAQARVGSANGK